MNKLHLLGTLGVCVIGLVSPNTLYAATYSITTIADTNGNFSGFGNHPSINDSGTVAYKAHFFSGEQAIYRSDSNIPIAITSGMFSDFGDPAINNNNTVAYTAGLDDGGYAIYSSASSTPIADTNGNFFNLGESPSINDSGTVAYVADDLSVRGVYNSNSSLPIADTSEALARIGDPSINNSGDTAFIAILDAGGDGIFINNSNIPIVDTNDLFVALHHPPSFNNQGTVVYRATTVGGEDGIFTSNSNIPVADTSGAFFDMSRVSINDSDTVVFDGIFELSEDGPTRSGVFTGPDPIVDAVITEGDMLNGSYVHNLLIGNEAINKTGQITFWANLTNGTTGIYLASPVPIPPSVWLFGSGLLGLVGMARRKKSA